MCNRVVCILRVPQASFELVAIEVLRSGARTILLEIHTAISATLFVNTEDTSSTN